MAAATIRSASRNTSFSPKSTSTRWGRHGAWTSRSAPPRRPTTKPGTCRSLSISRSGSETLKQPLKRGNPGAKHGKEEFDREEQPAEEDDQECCAQAGEAQGHHRRQEEADGRAFRGDAEARRIAAQFVGDPDSQPLRNHRPSALGLSQEQDEPHRDAGIRLEGAYPRPRQVELVR